MLSLLNVRKNIQRIIFILVLMNNKIFWKKKTHPSLSSTEKPAMTIPKVSRQNSLIICFWMSVFLRQKPNFYSISEVYRVDLAFIIYQSFYIVLILLDSNRISNTRNMLKDCFLTNLSRWNKYCQDRYQLFEVFFGYWTIPQVVSFFVAVQSNDLAQNFAGSVSIVNTIGKGGTWVFLYPFLIKISLFFFCKDFLL